MMYATRSGLSTEDLKKVMAQLAVIPLSARDSPETSSVSYIKVESRSDQMRWAFVSCYCRHTYGCGCEVL
jgi:hypothetical protein